MANMTTPYRLNDGRQAVDLDSAKTLAATDQGIVQNVIADGVTVTLPSTATALVFTVRNGGVKKTGSATGTGDDGSALVVLAPTAADAVAGNGFTATANKGASNTKATSRTGDEISVIGSGTAGVTAWNINRGVIGVWARVA